MVRDRLWEKCCQARQAGGVVQIYAMNNEQGFHIRLHGDTSRELRDWDGLQLIQIPNGGGEVSARIPRPPGPES